MQATSLCSLVLLPFSLSAKLMCRNAPPQKSFIFAASKRDPFGQHYNGNLVDENMILLRMRIRDVEMVETKMGAPSNWNEWEKKYFANYDSDVCDVVGLLQRMLMNTRPGFALGTLALLMLSMSMSISLLVFYLVELAKRII